MENIEEFQNYRHMLNKDSGGVGGQMQMGVGVDRMIKSIKKFQNYRHMLNTDSGGGGGQMQTGAEKEYKI